MNHESWGKRQLPSSAANHRKLRVNQLALERDTESTNAQHAFFNHLPGNKR